MFHDFKCVCIFLYVLSASRIWTHTWQDYNEHSYRVFLDDSISSSHAAETCQEMGALLVAINSPEEHDFISVQVVKQRTMSVFIGGSRYDEEREEIINGK